VIASRLAAPLVLVATACGARTPLGVGSVGGDASESATPAPPVSSPCTSWTVAVKRHASSGYPDAGLKRFSLG
jgi:hypothetical protein